MVTGLIGTVDGVMGHIASNLQAGAPQVAIAGSSSVAGTGQVGGVDGRGGGRLPWGPRPLGPGGRTHKPPQRLRASVG